MNLQELLQAGAASRVRRLSSAEMLTIEQVAARIGISPSKVTRLVEAGQAIGVRSEPLGTRLPVWQFDPPIWSAIERLGRELGTKDGWTLLAFLEVPLGALEGRTPRAALEQGDVERVLVVARFVD